MARCIADPALVGTASGLAAVLVSAALVYVVLAGIAVIVLVARRAWQALLIRPYTTPDAESGGDAEGRTSR